MSAFRINTNHLCFDLFQIPGFQVELMISEILFGVEKIFLQQTDGT